MNIYYFADAFTVVIEAFMIFMLLETFFKRRSGFSVWMYVAGMCVLSILLGISNVIFDFDLLNACGMVLSVFLISLMYDGSLTVKILVSVLSILFIAVVEIIVMFFITLIFNITVEEAVHIQEYRLLGIIVSKMAAFAVFNIIRVKLKGHGFDTGTSYWTLFFWLFANAIVAVFLLFKMSYELKTTSMNNLSIICSFGLLFSAVFALYLYEHLAKQAEMIRTQEQHEQHLKMQLKHLDEIVVQQAQLKSFKHDLPNQLVALRGYFDRGDCSGGRKHIDRLSEMFVEGSSSIDTGNVALDAIVSTKKAVAEKKNIEFTSQIQIPENINIEPVDVCAIFGNALDNAIEACDRIADKPKKITLTIICQDRTIFCKIVNTVSHPNVNISNTSKQDSSNHGLGLVNLKEALSNYNSEPVIEITENEFILKFVLFTK